MERGENRRVWHAGFVIAKACHCPVHSFGGSVSLSIEGPWGHRASIRSLSPYEKCDLCMSEWGGINAPYKKKDPSGIAILNDTAALRSIIICEKERVAQLTIQHCDWHGDDDGVKQRRIGLL